MRIPLFGPASPDQIQLSPERNGRISLIVRDAPLNEVLAALAIQHQVNIVTAEDVTGRISVTIRDVSFEDALTSITSVGGFTWSAHNGIIQVTNLAGTAKAAPLAQGRIVRVFPLNFVSGTDVETVAKGLLSPVGQIFTTLASASDNRKTRDMVVVEDLPQYVDRVADYICQVDHPPRQVLIEAHVLQVELTDDLRCGINWQALADTSTAAMTLKSVGLASAAATPATLFTLRATDFEALVEFIQATTDAKTLAQPRVLVLNGQQAKIQIGKKLGYLVTTTTQTSTLQNVNFLDVGVLLTVRPQISDDQHVMLTVKPEVSDGQINPDTSLPDQTTTEVETTVMLADGQGIVIGGLIKESDIDRQTKVPLLGDLWLVGRLFRRQNVIRQRNEIVIALIPRIVPYAPDYMAKDMSSYQQATTPLLQGPLNRVDRPWEAKLPDAMDNPRRLCLKRTPDMVRNLDDKRPYAPSHYFPTTSETEPWIRPGMYETNVIVEPVPGFAPADEDAPPPGGALPPAPPPGPPAPLPGPIETGPILMHSPPPGASPRGVRPPQTVQQAGAPSKPTSPGRRYLFPREPRNGQ